MKILCEHEKLGSLDAAVFDFDGTLSSLRAGWEKVMEPLMVELIPGDKEEVTELVRKYIDESTGIQTIFQMRWLKEEITKRGGKALDEWEYKDEYNRRLMIEVGRRRQAILSGEEKAEHYLVPGGKEFLEELKKMGVTMYAASGTDTVDVKAEAAVLGLDGYFAEIAGAERGTDDCSKEAVLRRLVKPGKKLLVVGDGKVEIALGREAGALTLGIASMDIPGCDSDEMNADKYRRLENAGAHAIIPHFANVKEILTWI